MTLRATEVEITHPCPIDLPAEFQGGASRRHCGHCGKAVHLLSSLTETEATALLATNAERNICVTYLVDGDGEILFRPEPIVPATALRRPRLAAAAAAGLGLALAACAPHGDTHAELDPTQEAQPSSADAPVIPALAEPCETRILEPPPSVRAGFIGVADPGHPDAGEAEGPKPEPAKPEPVEAATAPKMFAGARVPVKNPGHRRR